MEWQVSASLIFISISVCPMGSMSFIKFDSEIDSNSFTSHAGGFSGSTVIGTHLTNNLNSENSILNINEDQDFGNRIKRCPLESTY
jgi:hypothetical protein